ncbi:MAG: tetratricopeptide repeat protein [Ginsengibacter sp.]
MKKIGLMVSSFLLLANVLFAQSIDEGKKFLNYDRWESAAKVFKALLSANPNNIEAAYWLGQTYLQNPDFTDTMAAKELYQKTLQANPNEPLLIVGMGEVELFEGKLADARNRFETAINTTKKKDLDPILVAVGRANVNAKSGNAEYAIDKLGIAKERDKKNRNADIYLALGDAYRKLIDGANATMSYQTAISIDPKNARPYFMIGRIYETQGFGQEAIYMKYYKDAIQADPNFAPVYYWLYGYYYQRDVNKAREYLNEYVKVADQDSKNCHAEASLLYVSQLYEEAIKKADGCITGAPGAKPFPALYALKAYSYEKLGDIGKAKQFFDEYFVHVNPDNIGPKDYALYAEVLMKTPGNDAKAEEYVQKAIDLDTIPANKLNYVRDVAKSLYNTGNFADAGKWYKKVLYMTPDYGKVDLYWAGFSEYRAGDYVVADSVFQLYQQRFPDDLYGWYLGARSKEGIDTGSTGLAKPDYETIIRLADTIADKESIKDKLIPAFRYMVAYYYNLKGNTEKALEFNERILGVDPQDPTALKTKEALTPLLKKGNASSGAKK